MLSDSSCKAGADGSCLRAPRPPGAPGSGSAPELCGSGSGCELDGCRGPAVHTVTVPLPEGRGGHHPRCACVLCSMNVSTWLWSALRNKVDVHIVAAPLPVHVCRQTWRGPPEVHRQKHIQSTCTSMCASCLILSSAWLCSEGPGNPQKPAHAFCVFWALHRRVPQISHFAQSVSHCAALAKPTMVGSECNPCTKHRTACGGCRVQQARDR